MLLVRGEAFLGSFRYDVRYEHHDSTMGELVTFD